MKLLPILSPLFFRKIVEIEVFALWPAILDECELSMPTPFGTYETNMVAHTSKLSILTSLRKKIEDCEQCTFFLKLICQSLLFLFESLQLMEPQEMRPLIRWTKHWTPMLSEVLALSFYLLSCVDGGIYHTQ